VALLHESRIELVGLGDFLAPAARANKVGHHDTVDEHHHDGGKDAKQEMNARRRNRRRCWIMPQPATVQTQEQGPQQTHPREKGEQRKEAVHNPSLMARPQEMITSPARAWL